jgi:hypothetical protein
MCTSAWRLRAFIVLDPYSYTYSYTHISKAASYRVRVPLHRIFVASFVDKNRRLPTIEPQNFEGKSVPFGTQEIRNNGSPSPASFLIS